MSPLKGTVCCKSAQIATRNTGTARAAIRSKKGGIMQSLFYTLTLLTAGFTASAIAANLYRISGFVPETTSGHFVRVVVLMFAGPSEIFESAIHGRVARQLSAIPFWLSISAVSYWSLLLGFIVIQIAKSFSA